MLPFFHLTLHLLFLCIYYDEIMESPCSEEVVWKYIAAWAESDNSIPDYLNSFAANKKRANDCPLSSCQLSFYLNFTAVPYAITSAALCMMADVE